jgi:hypothetical protein
LNPGKPAETLVETNAHDIGAEKLLARPSDFACGLPGQHRAFLRGLSILRSIILHAAGILVHAPYRPAGIGRPETIASELHRN